MKNAFPALVLSVPLFVASTPAFAQATADVRCAEPHTQRAIHEALILVAQELAEVAGARADDGSARSVVEVVAGDWAEPLWATTTRPRRRGAQATSELPSHVNQAGREARGGAAACRRPALSYPCC